jgi:hypothetical protein
MNMEVDAIAEQPIMPSQETPPQVDNTVPGNIDPEQKPAGTLFDSISYKHNEDVTMWLERMNPQDAIFGLISAAAYGHKKGIYNLLESEIVSKAIRLITMQVPKQQSVDAVGNYGMGGTQPGRDVRDEMPPMPEPEPETPVTPVQ